MVQDSKRILLASSEAVPFAKSGGLGDVSSALPIALKKRGHDVRIVIPRYWQIDKEKFNLKSVVAPMGVQTGTSVIWCSVLEGCLGDVPVYFIDHEGYFGRAGYYDDGREEYYDNAERFAFFSRACIQLCCDLNFQPDIIHSNDWPTALISAYLKLWHLDEAFFEKTASVFSIHNIGYQGIFPRKFEAFLGLGDMAFNEDVLESHGKLHFMKAALFYADAISTVSPTYAKEIICPVGANGLAPYIERRSEDLFGILNGVDYEHWNPETDDLIPAKYSVDDMSGKEICKDVLQKEFYLKVKKDIPIIGIVSRFVQQKGLDLLAAVIEEVVEKMVVQFAIVGSGQKNLEDFFGGLPAHYCGQIGAWIGYNEYKAHLIEAGCDFFLMPSLYEPCGLNQIYSLKYGTLPIVRATGGLRDTVENYNEQTGGGTGFAFDAMDPKALFNTIGWAVSTYYDRPVHIEQMQRRGMQKHFSWDDAAVEYEKMYDKSLYRRESWC